MGSAGIGEGGTPEFGTADPNFSTEHAKSKLDAKGRIGVTSFRAVPRPGELTVEMKSAVEQARAEAEAPLDQEEIPRRYRDGIRSYFDGLGNRPAAPPAPPSPPAPPGKK